MKRNITLRVDGDEITVTARRDGDAIIVERDGVEHTVYVVAEQPAEPAPAPEKKPAPAAPRPAAASAPKPPAEPVTPTGAETVGEGVSAARAPMTGVIKEVLVSAGDAVTEGQRVVVMEAMKMDVYVNAPASGTVKTVAAVADNAVEGGSVLLTVEVGEP
jgi:biotin carboxyl carrier protein